MESGRGEERRKYKEGRGDINKETGEKDEERGGGDRIRRGGGKRVERRKTEDEERR